MMAISRSSPCLICSFVSGPVVYPQLQVLKSTFCKSSRTEIGQCPVILQKGKYVFNGERGKRVGGRLDIY